MATDPLISCLCLTRNRPRFVERQAELFRQQTYPRKELLILDDSPVAQRARVQSDDVVKYMTLDRVSAFVQRHSVILAAARGDLLCYWDDDDWSHPDRLAYQAAPILSGRYDITGIPLGCVSTVTLPDLRFWKLERKPGPRIWPKTAHGARPDKPAILFSDGTTLLRRSLLSRLSTLELQLPKVPLIQELLVKGGRWQRVTNPWLFVYVRHGGNVTTLDADKWKLTPLPRPTWVPDAQFAFWQTQPWRVDAR